MKRHSWEKTKKEINSFCKVTLVTLWEIQSRGWWCSSLRLRLHWLLWCSHGQCRGPGQYFSSKDIHWKLTQPVKTNSSISRTHMMDSTVKPSKTDTIVLKYLRSVKDCPVVLCIAHCWVVLDLLKSVEKTNFQIPLLFSPVPGPLFTSEVGNKVVNGLLDSLLQHSTVA